MVEQFQRHIARLLPHAREKKFLLAVSGGADSSVMAWLFHHCGLSFAMAHCNFHLRGEESDKDMLLVREMAEKYGVQYHEKEFDTLAYQKQHGLSLEMAARELRYAWFDQISEGFDYVVTAHNANDNAETFLLNMTRGTGLKGLTGIPEMNGKLLRPLLPFSSAQIRHFAAEKGMVYRNDVTNFSEAFQRNKIRISVIPKLEELNPDLISTFSRNIDLLKRQYYFYQRQMKNNLSSIVSEKNGLLYISIEELMKCEDQALVLYEILKDYGFNASSVEQILDSFRKSSGKLFYSSHYQVLKDRKYLIIKSIESIQTKEKSIEKIEDLENLGFAVEEFIMEEWPDFEKNTNILYIDTEKLVFPLVLRHWREGDRFHPLGLKGAKKLSDFFIDQKINLLEKKNIPVLCSGDKIVWLVGLRGDDRFKIDYQTKKYYKIQYHGSF
ncbi:MAG: tRNA lysidine(34) synthetase TilS [Bacteroidales bacterium]|nr:tRNA lysidine(34) synthetase TilS [Bacteroidales bacterium]